MDPPFFHTKKSRKTRTDGRTGGEVGSKSSLLHPYHPLPPSSPVGIPRPRVLLRPQLAVRHAEPARQRGPREGAVHRAPRAPPAAQETVRVCVPRGVALPVGVHADVRLLQLR